MRHYEIRRKKTHNHLNDEKPSYRFYEKKRRKAAWSEYLTKYLLRIILIMFIAPFILSLAIGLFAFFVYGQSVLLSLLLGLLIVTVLSIPLTRTVRKRLKFIRKLKRFCKKEGFSLKSEQNFFESLVWSPEQQDLVLKTKNRIYYVRYLTLRHYRATLFLENADKLRLVSRPLKNVFTVVFDIGTKEKIYPLSFNVPTPMYNIPTVKALIVNPVCEEIKYKKSSGGYEQTGSGGEHFGFTVFTGSGFLETLKRDN